jgi:hypothetical protein
MSLTPQEENEAMKTYLGGGEGKGYDPVARDERLRKRYGPGWRKVKEALDEYLDPLIRRPEGWDREDVQASAARLGLIIEENFPWFDETARGLMVSCFVYEWK